MALAAVACPTIPFCAQAGLRWNDLLPLTELTPMQYFRKVLSPFEVQAFTTIACECLSEPDTTSPRTGHPRATGHAPRVCPSAAR
jgi:hypothetical protein